MTSQLTMTSEKECKYYKLGKCRFGKNCKYAHPDLYCDLCADKRKVPQTEDQKYLCMGFLCSSGCKSGLACTLIHLPEEYLAILCNKDCMNRDGCKNPRCSRWHRPTVDIKKTNPKTCSFYYKSLDGCEYSKDCSTMVDVIQFFESLKIQRLEKRRLLMRLRVPVTHKHLQVHF